VSLPRRLARREQGREVISPRGGWLQRLASGPAPHRDFIKMVVGYALTCKTPLPVVTNTVEEARYQARKAGRAHVVATDIRTALLDYQIPSDEALQNAFQPDRPSLRPAVMLQASVSPILQGRCKNVATGLQ
jgi:hypothetical protein